MKDLLKIIATLLPLGVKLFKDIKKARDKNERKKMREHLKNSRNNYDSIRRRLIGK